MTLDITVDPRELVVTLKTKGVIELDDLYRAIRNWEASESGIVYPRILDSIGRVKLPDETVTPRVIVFVGGWKLAALEETSIVGGYIAGKDADGTAINPIVAESRNRIRLLGEVKQSVPTEAQARDALRRAATFEEDWEIETQPRLQIRRKQDASERKHSVIGLYWFCKQQYLKKPDLLKFLFPVHGGANAEDGGDVREFELVAPWSIPEKDRGYLFDGPLIHDTVEIVPRRRSGDQDQRAIDPRAVTVGAVVALPKEYAAVLAQFDEVADYQGASGRHYRIGSMPSLDGQHTVALIQCGVGNNRAAARLSILLSDFKNLRSVFMVGIAGAVPHPTKPDDHVRLGDIIVSDEYGIVQYDMGKQTGEGWIDRHQPRPPGPRLLDAAHRLEADTLRTDLDWSALLSRTTALKHSARPALETDVLVRTPPLRGRFGRFLERVGCAWKGGNSIAHPHDPNRKEGEPRIFIGRIGAANRVLKDAVARDDLRDRYGIKAVEMESSGIAEATYDYQGVEYLVVRGTCDYCDSTKGDAWQGYASCVAAAYLTALLRRMFTA